MNQSKLNFKSEKLTVDWVSFKFQNLKAETKIEIAEYFYQLGFNSSQESAKSARPIKESILMNSTNKWQIWFIEDNLYWRGTLLTISGFNAAQFYRLVQKKSIDWKILSSAVLSRFDLYYSRKPKIKDSISAQDFLIECQKKLKHDFKKSGFQKTQKGAILKVGSRRSNNYSRIYETRDSLKFELEMKGTFLRDYHTLLVDNNLVKFEHDLSFHFLTYFGMLLPLTYSYVDWLVIKLRPIRNQQLLFSGLRSLQSHYIYSMDSQTEVNRQDFFTFVQFLAYAQSLDYEIGSLGTTYYRQVKFLVRDFLEYQNKSNNYYQLKKLVMFFNQLQTNSLIQFFSDKQYRSLVTIPEVNLEKHTNKSWIATIWIAEELFYYVHPFLLPDVGEQKLTKHEFAVYFKVIQVFSSINVEKVFSVKKFFANYPSALTNQQKTKMKKTFIQIIEKFKKYKLIEPTYKIILNGNSHKKDKLTSSSISEGFIIYEKLTI